MGLASVIITKGLPFQFTVTMTNNDIPVNINDDTWTFNIKIHEKTERGTIPFELLTTPSGNGVQVSITSEQTQLLSTQEGDFVFVIKASKTDQTVNLRSVVRVAVIDDV